MPVESLLQSGIENVRQSMPDPAKAYQIAANIALQKKQLENENQLIQMRKDQMEELKTDKLHKAFELAASSDEPTKQKFYLGAFQNLSEQFGRPANKEVLDGLIKIPENRKKLMDALSNIKEMETIDPGIRANYAKQMVQLGVSSNLLDASNTLDKLFADTTAVIKAREGYAALTGRQTLQSFGADFSKQMSGTGLSTLPKQQQAILNAGLAQRDAAFKAAQDPNSPFSQALSSLRLANSSGKEETRQVGIETKQNMMEMRQKRFGLSLRQFDLKTQQQAMTAMDKVMASVKSDYDVIKQEAPTKELIESGQPLNKLTAQELKAGLQRLYQGTGVLSEGRRKALELNTVQSFINNQLSKLDPNQPIPANLEELYKATWKRAYQAKIEATDEMVQRGISARMGFSPALRKAGQEAMNTFQLGEGYRPVAFGQKPGKQMDMGMDISSYIKGAPKGYTLGQFKAKLDATPDSPAKRKAMLIYQSIVNKK